MELREGLPVRNEVKAGYKNTEVGVIPEDWVVKELRTILNFGSGKDYKHLHNGEIPVYGTGGIMTYVDDFLYDGESVGIGRKGTIDKPVFLNGKFWTVDTLFYTHQFIESNPKFIYYKFNLIKWKDFNEASGVPSLNKNTLEKIKISIPDLSEQTAIATALSDADALINSLEKLIAKKRNIKQGAMQQLLKPKDGWEVKKLGEIAEIYQPQTISQDVFVEDGYLVYGANGVIGKFHLFNHETWQTTITCRGSTCGTVNRTIDKSWITGNAMVMNVDENRNIDKLFFYYILTKQDFSQCITGSGQPQIVRSPLFDFTISIPKSKEKQKEIAFILSDMDAEINALETKLEKYKKVKLGMMQVLLTGKVRLV